MLDGRDKDFSRLVETVAGVQQGIDTHAIPAPRFDLVEVAQVGIERVVGLFVGPIAHDTVPAARCSDGFSYFSGDGQAFYGSVYITASVQHPRPLPDGQPNTRAVLDCGLEYLPSLVQAAASVEHALNSTILRPLLDPDCGGQRAVARLFLRRGLGFSPPNGPRCTPTKRIPERPRPLESLQPSV